MDNSEHLSPYLAVQASFESPAYLVHLALVANAYLQKGFMDANTAADPADGYDTKDAAYCLLYMRTAPKTLAGTFRLIKGVYGLPLLSIFPHLAIEGIAAKLCESTRVVSSTRSLSGGADPARQILFEAVIRSVAYAQMNGMTGLISLGSPRIFERINATFFGTQHGLAAPCLYQGGIVIPSIIWVDEFENCLAKRDERMHMRYAEAKAAWTKK